MRGCKRLKNINSVSGKLGERQVDPLETVATVCFAVSETTDSGPLGLPSTMTSSIDQRASVLIAPFLSQGPISYLTTCFTTADVLVR